MFSADVATRKGLVLLCCLMMMMLCLSFKLLLNTLQTKQKIILAVYILMLFAVVN